MDRISQLPDVVVDHILSNLNFSNVELVRMSVLSKTWFHLTASFPDLYFVIYNFISRESFFKYVEYTTSRFCHHNFIAREFELVTTIEESAELDIVNRCIGLVLNNGVEELVIDISYLSDVPKYRLPNTLLSVSVLKSLTLLRCELPSSLMLDAVKFKSLTYLRLHKVHINNEAIGYLTTSCPLLRIFHIIKCDGFTSFCVYGHQNLDIVLIVYKTLVERIHIEAPNLSRLLVVDWAEIERTPLMNVASCKKLTTVHYWGHILPNSNVFTNFLSNFPFIENFCLITSREGNNLKLSSHSLRRLVLHSYCDLEDIELSTPNLDLIVYSGSFSDLSMDKHLTHLEKSLRCYIHDYVDSLWFHNLRLFLGKKNGFKALNLYICTTQKFTKLEELKAIELPPYELEHVEIQLDNHDESLAHIAFVDAVLWCCRPRSLTLISSTSLTDFEEQSDIFMFTYKKLLQQGDHDQGRANIKIVSPALPHKGKAISFLKEKVLQEAEHRIKRLRV